MPAYDFVCDVDGEAQEARLPVDARDTPVLCAQGHRMRRVIPPVGFQLRGKFSPEYWGYKESRDDGLTPLAE